MFERATELQPLSSIPYFNRWIIHMQRQQRPRASEAVAREALARWPDNSGFRSMLGWSILTQGRFSDSIPEFRAALELDPNHAYSLPNLAYVLYATGEVDEAVELFTRVLGLADSGALGGSRWAAVRDLALALTAAGRVGEADILVLEQSKRTRSGRRGATLGVDDYLSLAQLSAAVGRKDEARRWLRTAETSGLTDGDQRVTYSAALALLGESDAALMELGAALEAGVSDFFVPLVLPPFNSLLDEPEFLELFGIEEIT
jgi:tetratricopeptide (TPR) repeat protein